jgi:hypothetical protein
MGRLTKKEKARNGYLIRYYGITLAKYEAILEAQGGACAICRKPASKFARSLAVDHDHRSGVVRGLLCPWCNRGLKYFNDDPDNHRRAAEHLERDYGTVPEKYLKGRPKRRRRKSTRNRRR